VRRVDQADAGSGGLANELDVLGGVREAVGPEPDPGKRRLTERDRERSLYFKNPS
jgi:hypothetical protein